MERGKEITDLTICRALLAGWVFIYHLDLYVQFAKYLGPAAGLIRHGYLGVDGFFILSGLILARVHDEFGKSLAGITRFWAKRLVRIYPVHLATLIILAILFVLGTASGIVPHDPGRFSLLSLVENLLLVQGWGFGNPLAWNYPSWAVSAEWAGYLLFPFLLLMFSRWTLMISGNCLVLTLPLYGLLVHFSSYQLNITGGAALIRFFLEFIGGLTMARLVPFLADSVRGWIFLVPGILLIVIGLLVPYDPVVVYGLSFVLFGFTAQADAERRPLLGNRRILRALGHISYSFYMSFGIVELLVTQFFRRQGWSFVSYGALYAVAMTGLTFLLALVLYVAVERPCRRYGDRKLVPLPPEAPKGQPLAVMRKHG